MTVGYTVLAVTSVVVVWLLERRVWRTGLLRRRSYHCTLAICLFFMVLVNGWLTKLSAPIVRYAPDGRTGWRLPWDIPVEDYLFGWSMLTFALLLWERETRTDGSAQERADHG